MLDGVYTCKLRVLLNVTWRDRLNSDRFYAKLRPVSGTIKERRVRYAGHCWRAKDEIVTELLLWEPRQGRADGGR